MKTLATIQQSTFWVMVYGDLLAPSSSGSGNITKLIECILRLTCGYEAQKRKPLLVFVTGTFGDDKSYEFRSEQYNLLKRFCNAANINHVEQNLQGELADKPSADLVLLAATTPEGMEFLESHAGFFEDEEKDTQLIVRCQLAEAELLNRTTQTPMPDKLPEQPDASEGKDGRYSYLTEHFDDLPIQKRIWDGKPRVRYDFQLPKDLYVPTYSPFFL